MASAAWELQKSIHAALTSDAALTALLGGARVYDDVPRGAEFPYVTFGQSTARDWSTDSEAGSEHIVTLNVWSRHAGEREAHLIMARCAMRLHEAELAVAGHRLVNCATKCRRRRAMPMARPIAASSASVPCWSLNRQ